MRYLKADFVGALCRTLIPWIPRRSWLGIVIPAGKLTLRSSPHRSPSSSHRVGLNPRPAALIASGSKPRFVNHVRAALPASLQRASVQDSANCRARIDQRVRSIFGCSGGGASLCGRVEVSPVSLITASRAVMCSRRFR